MELFNQHQRIKKICVNFHCFFHARNNKIRYVYQSHNELFRNALPKCVREISIIYAKHIL